MAVEAPAEQLHSLLSITVDADFYHALYPDVAQGGQSAAQHYGGSGWREGRDPAPWFSTNRYLEANPDVAALDVNPLHHFLTAGRHEGREAFRSWKADDYFLSGPDAERGWRFIDPASAESLAVTEQARAVAEQVAADREAVQAEFDAAYYLDANPDVAALGSDPLDHFMLFGWREDRNPNRAFSVRDYLDTYPDIAQADVNPFAHYLRAGRAEGRIPRNALGFRYDIIRALKPVAERVAEVANAGSSLELQPQPVLDAAFAAAPGGLRDVHITFSHDDFSVNTGGVQLCLQREAAHIHGLGRDHLHLYPSAPWPVVRTLGELGHMGVVLNGQNLGAFAPRTVADALAAANAAGGRRSFAIHSLLGHCAQEVIDVLRAAGLRDGFFWLHDFTSLCAGYHLLRNDVEDCAAPPADSAACGVCIYSPWRARHVAEHRTLFEGLSLTVVSPSQPTLDLWQARSDLPAARTVVLPHATLADRGPAPAPAPDQARPLRIAYAGMPAPHKGWPLFQKLVEKYADDPRYDFLHLGGRTPGGLPLEFHRVVVTDEEPRAMQDAIEQTQADLVLIWPLCRETFSFVAYEAVAGGAAILTWPDSGNVAAFVTGSGLGRVLDDEAALDAALEAGAFDGLARAARQARLADLKFSRLTVDLLEAGA